MWNALKSDLLDFVSTIKEDTAKALSSATGAEADEEETIVALRLKQLQDVKRSYDTFSLAVEDAGFTKFMRSFSLSTYAAEIAQLLDDEPDVARYYAELVPVQISPEQFWARCFFRLSVVSRGGVMLDDEEEDLEWETSDASLPAKEDGGGLSERVKELEAENAELKAHVKALVSRVAELETGGATGLQDQGSKAKVRSVEPPTATATATAPAPPPAPAPSPAQTPVPVPVSAPAPATVEQPVGTTATTTATTTSPLPDDTVLVGRPPKIKDLANLDEDEDEDWGE